MAGEITRVIFATFVLIVILLSFSVFYSDYSGKNIAVPASYTVLSESASSAANLTSTLTDMSGLASALTSQDSGILQIPFAVVQGALSFIKLPLNIASLLNAIVDDTLSLIQIPIEIITLIKLGLIIMVALGIIAYVGKTPSP